MERDVLEKLVELRGIVGNGDPSGNCWEIRAVDEAIAEIERLRSLAGAVSNGPDFATLRQQAKQQAE